MSDKQVESLVSFFEAGCKTSEQFNMGVEIEHIPVDIRTGEAASFYGEDGVETVLSEYNNFMPGEMVIHNRYLLGLTYRDYNITLEPAAQFEISLKPCSEVGEIKYIYEQFRALADMYFKKHGLKLLNIGYQPVSHVSDLKLIPKERYEYMNDFFLTSGTRGMNMMRGTASTQVSVDYTSEKDFVRKFRLAYILGPAFRILTDNVPVFEGSPAESHLMRTQIWNNVDPARCGIIPGIEREGFGFKAYGSWLLSMPLILKTTGDKSVCTGNKTAGEVYADSDITPEDAAHIASMAFPDVRLKQFIEIRMADSLPCDLICAYAALIKGIFSSNASISELIEKYPIDPEAIKASDASLMEKGFAGEIYGRGAIDFCRELISLASENLGDESKYLAPFEFCLNSGKTWAEKPYESYLEAASAN